jgi:hypothetical protein
LQQTKKFLQRKRRPQKKPDRSSNHRPRRQCTDCCKCRGTYAGTFPKRKKSLEKSTKKNGEREKGFRKGRKKTLGREEKH